jgi:GntR family transcriptional regulator
MRLNRLVPFTALIEQCGHAASVDRQTHRVAEPSPEAAKALGVTTATPCLLVERLLRAGGRPVITVLDVVPVRRLAVAPEAVVESDTSFDFLVANGVQPVDYTVAEMVPRVAAGAHIPDALEIPPGDPYLELLETHFSRNHERLAVSRIAVDDRLVRFSLLRRD